MLLPPALACRSVGESPLFCSSRPWRLGSDGRLCHPLGRALQAVCCKVTWAEPFLTATQLRPPLCACARGDLLGDPTSVGTCSVTPRLNLQASGLCVNSLKGSAEHSRPPNALAEGLGVGGRGPGPGAGSPLFPALCLLAQARPAGYLVCPSVWQVALGWCWRPVPW